MEDIIVNRPRYKRHNVPIRRRNKRSTNKRSTSTSVPYIERMMRQIIICTIILVGVGIIKNVNLPLTKYASEKIKWVLQQDINIKSTYETLNSYLNGYFKNTKDNTKTITNKITLPTTSTDQKVNTQTKVSTVGNKGTTGNLKISFIAPIDGKINSPFGMRTDPFSENDKMHTGIDIQAANGDKIKAAANGVVTVVDVSKDYGNYIKLKHDNSIVTLYAHCSQIIAKKGQKVKQGDIIAKVGNTGASTGAHLHFEVIKDGTAVNPLDYIKISSES